MAISLLDPLTSHSFCWLLKLIDWHWLVSKHNLIHCMTSVTLCDEITWPGSALPGPNRSSNNAPETRWKIEEKWRVLILGFYLSLIWRVHTRQVVLLSIKSSTSRSKWVFQARGGSSRKTLSRILSNSPMDSMFRLSVPVVDLSWRQTWQVINQAHESLESLLSKTEQTWWNSLLEFSAMNRNIQLKN